MARKTPLIPMDALQKVRLVPLRKGAGRIGVVLAGPDGQVLCGDATLPRHFQGKPGERCEWVEGSRRRLVVGCGRPGADARMFWESAGALVVQALQAAHVETAELGAPLPDDALPSFAVGALLAGYDNQLYRSVPAKTSLRAVDLSIPGARKAALDRAATVAAAVNWTRALVEAPPNHLTPQSFADEVRALAVPGLQVEVLDVAALTKLGAHGLLSVGRSSQHPPCMVVARWMGRRGKDLDLAVVGKGLTFDGGGLNLKTVIIEKMKFDMGGAAAAIGALRLLAQRRASANVAVVLVLCENVIGGDAYRPGDVIGSLEGLTIEVANTDAEGRIVVADGLSYAKRLKPRFLVDIATLTGSIAATLHQEFAGLYSADDELVKLIAAAADATGDLVWRMPLSPLQDYVVESEIADVRNLGAMSAIGVPSAGSSVAGAKFLECFAKGSRWAHLDMASTVLGSRQRGPLRPGPTGWGVRLLDDLAERMAVGRDA